jgi:hypothetical protein
MRLLHLILAITLTSTSVLPVVGQSKNFEWPAANRETKPWSRWWWHGSAVTKEGITAEMEAYKKAGLGGLEITPIYGVYGKEEQFVDYLTPQWMELLIHTMKEAERLDMGIDMATGTGWPFGGPWVDDSDACKNLEHKVYDLSAGESLEEKIFFVQEPFVRAVGSQIYEVHDTTISKESVAGTLKEPLQSGKPEMRIDDLVEPVAANKNLQALALDQVKFKKPLPLQALMAYSDSGRILDLTSKVDKAGVLDWVAPEGYWKLYAVFMGWHGKMVERAGPGGEGNVIDHFSAPALGNYLARFDKAFENYNLSSLRAFFNDSYEVDDARGNADWTPLLFEEFKKRRGYDLKSHLPALFRQDVSDLNERVLCDYRETISELVLENFTFRWKKWAHGKNALVRNQAHGSPSNILDLYATVDIPEIEGVEALRIKMATSAGNVTGKKLISSESATWLNEHFESSLSDIKTAVDRFMVQGVNHIFYHGTCYSPPDEPWPGWLFYAAVHLNPRNSLWPHFGALNKYIERSQSLLQNSAPDNDVLLYYPIYDRFSTPGEEMIEHFDAVGPQFESTAFKQAAEKMLADGYAFDYISDKQLGQTNFENGDLVTEGKRGYKTVVIPHCKYIPVATLRKIWSLAESGATVVFYDGLPSSFNGYANMEENKKLFDALIEKIRPLQLEKAKEKKLGLGKLLIGSDLELLLGYASARREKMVHSGLQFLRKKGQDNSTIYFIVNNDKFFDGWIPLEAMGKSGILYNPMTGEVGRGETRESASGKLEVRLQMQPAETLIVKVSPGRRDDVPYFYHKKLGNPLDISGPWQISFDEGGPEVPPDQTINVLASWTTLANPVNRSFSGTATYRTMFEKPRQKTSLWILDLGNVKESAEVILNGKSMGIVLGPMYRVNVPDTLLQNTNTLEVKVANLMANHIAYLDQHQIFWKKFYNVNFPARRAENRRNGLFDAGHWQPKPSGLIGPVILIPHDGEGP